MNQDRVNLISTYLNTNVAPLIIEGVTPANFPDAVILPSNCETTLLNGHYEGTEFISPKWYNDLMTKKDMKNNILVIDNLTNISLEEQLKFCEILKYRKISTFELPQNCCIVITCEKIDKTKISPEIYSLVAHV